MFRRFMLIKLNLIGKMLGSMVVIPKTGNESFSLEGKVLDFNLSNFWAWSQSDLLNNTLRGILAEYIVRQDIGVQKSIRT